MEEVSNVSKRKRLDKECHVLECKLHVAKKKRMEVVNDLFLHPEKEFFDENFNAVLDWMNKLSSKEKREKTLILPVSIPKCVFEFFKGHEDYRFMSKHFGLFACRRIKITIKLQGLAKGYKNSKGIFYQMEWDEDSKNVDEDIFYHIRGQLSDDEAVKLIDDDFSVKHLSFYLNNYKLERNDPRIYDFDIDADHHYPEKAVMNGKIDVELVELYCNKKFI